MAVSLSKPDALFVSTLAEAKALKVAIADLEVALKEKTAALVAMNGENTGKVTVATGSVTFSENNTYAEDTIRGLLSEGQQKRVEKRVIDKAKVKALYPDVYAASKVNNGIKVSIA